MIRLTDSQKEEIRDTLADKLGFDLDEIHDDSDLKNDLGTDSLDDIELIMEFEKIFNCNIPDSLAENVKKVSDIYKCIEQCV